MNCDMNLKTNSIFIAKCRTKKGIRVHFHFNKGFMDLLLKTCTMNQPDFVMKKTLRKILAGALIFSQSAMPAFADAFLYRHVTSSETVVVQAADEITVPGKVVELEPAEPIDVAADPYVELPASVPALTAGERVDIPFVLDNANGLSMFGSVPPGLFINAVNKTISGVPFRGGDYTFNMRAYLTAPGQDLKTHDSNNLTLTVLPALEVANSGPLQGFVGDAVSGQIITNADADDVTFEFETGEESRPSWLSIDGSGNLSGVVVDPGSWSVIVRATDSEGRTGLTAFPVQGFDEVDLALDAIYGATLNKSFAIVPTLSEGTWDGFFISQGSLPPGMTLNSRTGRISGIPTQQGAFAFELSGSLLGRTSSSGIVNVAVEDPIIVSVSNLPHGYQFDQYNTDGAAAVSASGGTPPYTFSFTRSVPGIEINEGTGVFGGTPTVGTGEGAAAISVLVEDSQGRTQSVKSAIYVATEVTLDGLPVLALPPMVDRPILLEEVGEASEGNPGYTWSVVGGPAWLSMNGPVLTGTPTETGTFNFDVQVEDSTGHIKSGSMSFTVDPDLVVTDAAFGPTQIGEMLNVTVQPTISGGVTPYSVVLAGAPTWMTVDSNGQLGGTALTSGNLSINMVVEDALGRVTTLPIAFNLASGLNITAPVFSNNMNGEVFTFDAQPSASGGFGPYTWEIGNYGSAGNPGLSIDENTGALSGTAGLPGQYSFDITITDTRGSTATRTVDVTIADNVGVTAPEFGASMVGDPVSVISNPVRTGGTGPFTWEVTSGPAWLILDGARGTFSGVASASGTFPIDIRVTDSQGYSATTSASIEISPSIVLTPPSIAETRTGDILIVNAQPSATGGSGDYSWSMTGAPGWMTIDAETGEIDGIAGVPVVTEGIEIKVVDSDGLSRVTEFSVSIFDVLALSAPVIGTAEQGVPLSIGQAVATSGLAPYSWSLHGDIPAWLEFDESTGRISGIPAYKASHSMTIEVTDSLGDTRSADFTINVDPVITMTAPVFETVAPFETLIVSEQPAAEGGLGRKTYSLTNAPDGMVIDSARGWISGTAPASGSYNFQITATDENTDSITITASITVPEDLVAVEPQVGVTYLGEDLNVTRHAVYVGGHAPITWELSQGPGWMSVSTLGQISGTPDQSGVAYAEITATDALGRQDTVGFYTETRTPLNIVNPTFGQAFAGASVPVTTQPSATGGIPPYTWAIESADGSLSLALNASTGALTVAETTADGSFPVTVSVTDDVGDTTESAFLVPVLPVLSLIAPTISTSVSGDELIVASQTQSVGGLGPVTWDVSDAPSWLNFNTATGEISGTPPTAGTFAFTINATDANGLEASVAATAVVVSPVTLAVDDVLDAEVGSSISGYSATATSGVSPLRFNMVSGPSWLNIGATGILSGVPTDEVDTTFTVSVTDALGYTDTATGSVQSTTPISMTALVMGNRATIGIPIEVDTQPQGYNGNGNYSWSISGAPDGVIINSSTGAVSGSPTQTGEFTMTITVTDDSGRAASEDTVMYVDSPLAITATPTFSAMQTEGEEIAVDGSSTSSATGGYGALVWTVEHANGAPDVGPVVATSGNVQGVAWTGFGTASFDFVVRDGYGREDRVSYNNIIVDQALSISWDDVIADARQGDEIVIGTQPAAVGGSGPYSWSFDSTHQATFAVVFNAGLQSPTISGTAWNNLGPTNIALKVVDADGREATISKAVNVTERLVVSGFDSNPGTAGSPFQTTVLPVAVNGTGPFAWSASGLPGGLVIDAATGQISGSPSTTGVFTIEIAARSSEGYTGREDFTIEVDALLAISSVVSVPTAYEGEAIPFEGTNTVTGGKSPYVWGLRDATPGFSIDSATGVLSGTGPTPGFHSVPITVVDADGRYAEGSVTMTVHEDYEIQVGEVQTYTRDLLVNPNETVLSFTGGNQSQTLHRWAIGNAPSWLRINSATGALSIIASPDTAGTTTVTVAVADIWVPGAFDTTTIDIVVRDPLSATPTALPISTSAGQAFVATSEAQVVGGSGNYTFTRLSNGESGFDLTSDGIATGTAGSVGGLFTETFLVEDGEGRSTTFTVNVGVDLATGSVQFSGSTVQNVVYSNNTPIFWTTARTPWVSFDFPDYMEGTVGIDNVNIGFITLEVVGAPTKCYLLAHTSWHTPDGSWSLRENTPAIIGNSANVSVYEKTYSPGTYAIQTSLAALYSCEGSLN